MQVACGSIGFAAEAAGMVRGVPDKVLHSQSFALGRNLMVAGKAPRGRTEGVLGRLEY